MIKRRKGRKVQYKMQEHEKNRIEKSKEHVRGV
jgi:hypothetical protein